MSDYIKKVAVIGGGTMGRGIAVTCVQSGFEVILIDTNQSVVADAKTWAFATWDMLSKKNKITESQVKSFEQNLTFSSQLVDAKADIIIEAIVEKLTIKQEVLKQIAAINDKNCIIVSNTSSLSITAIASAMPRPENVAGLHFFNPAPIMKLVELVKGEKTNHETLLILEYLIKKLNKSFVITKDAPGFIVNRVARHFYLESLKIAEEQGASIESIDALMESVGFKMGPFKLMDLIGNDINYSVTKSLFDAFHYDSKFRPSRLQEQKVLSNQLGCKSGEGFYVYPKE